MSCNGFLQKYGRLCRTEPGAAVPTLVTATPDLVTIFVHIGLVGQHDTSAERIILHVLVCIFFLHAHFNCSCRITASLAWWLRLPPRERKIPGSNPACDGIFPGSSHTGDLKIGTPAATLPGAWRSRVRAGTGWPGVNIL